MTGLNMKMTEQEYRSLNRLCQSDINRLLKSTKHYNVKTIQTDSMLKGRFLHSLVLQTDDKYMIVKKRTAELKQKHDNLILESWVDEYTRIANATINELSNIVIDEIYNKDLYSLIMESYREHKIQFTITNDDGFNVILLKDVLVKAMLDCCYIGDKNAIIVDLKFIPNNANDPNYIKYQKILKFGYDVQAYWYRLAVSKKYGIDFDDVSFYLAFCETETPFGVKIYKVNGDKYKCELGIQRYQEIKLGIERKTVYTQEIIDLDI